MDIPVSENDQKEGETDAFLVVHTLHIKTNYHCLLRKSKWNLFKQLKKYDAGKPNIFR